MRFQFAGLIRVLFVIVLVTVAGVGCGQRASIEVTPVDQLVELGFDAFLEQSFRQLVMRDPEWVTQLGLADELGTGNDQLTDISDGFVRKTQQLESDILTALRQFDQSTLTAEQRLSAEIYEWYLDDRVRAHEYMYYDYPVNHLLFSVPNGLLHFFTQIHPITNEQDVQDYITRLSQVDEKFDQLIDGLERRAEVGVVLPRYLIDWAAYDLDRIARGEAVDAAYYGALREKVLALDDLTQDEKDALLAQAAREIEKSVIPAYRALLDVLDDQEAIAANEDGVWRFANGADYYTQVLRHHTSTDLTADEIHELGLREVARIQGEMRVLFDDLDYPADESLAELFERVAVDGGWVSGAGVVDAYAQLITEVKGQLEPFFDLQPKADVVVIGGPTGGYYVRPALDGSRPGAFYANVDSSGEPRYGMATLAYHEAIPGHHLQLAIAQELELGLFRSNASFTAFIEGWALYAEQLAGEMNLYRDDPYGNLGRLQAELFRAARLVVDTGIHAKKWSHQQAIDYMVENVGRSRGYLEFEVNRYVVWPGQATAYKIGMLKILELRQRAMDRLGDRFDLQEFHRVVLGNGSMPLSVLEQVVEAYIAERLAG